MAKKDRAALDPVEAFRRQSSRKKSEASPLLKREWATIVSLCVLIVAAPWMLGSMRWLPQAILLGLSLIAFATLFIPANDRQQLPLHNLKRLLRFPGFWLGLFFLTYLLIQALNPALEIKHKDIPNWTRYSTAWLLSPMKHIDWLPAGISAPYYYGNTWRSLVMWAAPVFAVWAAWGGLKHRRSVVIIFWVICINGAAIALVGLLMKLSGTNKILWTYPITGFGFFGPFHYRNHGAAYLYPILALCFGMFFYYRQRARKYLRQSSPSIFFMLMGLFIAATLIVNLSRGGILMTVGVVIPFIGLYLLSLLRGGSAKKLLSGIALLVVVLSAGVFGTLQLVGVEDIKEEFNELAGSDFRAKNALEIRYIMMEATSEMYLERPLYGWGAGSFRWVFRNYQLKKKYELLWRPFPAKHKKVSIHNAHCDLIQFPAEFGSVGAGILLSLLIFWLGAALYYVKAMSFEHVMIATGPAMLLAHASFEFNLSNPAVLLLFSMIISLTVLWLRLNPRFQKAA